MKTIVFKHLKEFGTISGGIITMKALITIAGVQYVECYENKTRYKTSELTEVIN